MSSIYRKAKDKVAASSTRKGDTASTRKGDTASTRKGPPDEASSPVDTDQESLRSNASSLRTSLTRRLSRKGKPKDNKKQSGTAKTRRPPSVIEPSVTQSSIDPTDLRPSKSTSSNQLQSTSLTSHQPSDDSKNDPPDNAIGATAKPPSTSPENKSPKPTTDNTIDDHDKHINDPVSANAPLHDESISLQPPPATSDSSRKSPDTPVPHLPGATDELPGATDEPKDVASHHSNNPPEPKPTSPGRRSSSSPSERDMPPSFVQENEAQKGPGSTSSSPLKRDKSPPLFQEDEAQKGPESTSSSPLKRDKSPQLLQEDESQKGPEIESPKSSGSTDLPVSNQEAPPTIKGDTMQQGSDSTPLPGSNIPPPLIYSRNADTAHNPNRNEYEPIMSSNHPSIMNQSPSEQPPAGPDTLQAPLYDESSSSLSQSPMSPSTSAPINERRFPDSSPKSNPRLTNDVPEFNPAPVNQQMLPFSPQNKSHYQNFDHLPLSGLSPIASTGHLPVNESLGYGAVPNLDVRPRSTSISARLSNPNLPNMYPNSIGTTSNPNIASALENPIEPSELQPLLSPRNSITSQNVAVPAQASWSIILLLSKVFEYCYHRNPKSSAGILVAIVALFMLFYLTLSNSDSLIMQAVQADFSSISILDLNDDGVTFHVIGSTYMEYGNISNHFYRYFMKVAALIVGSITVTPKQAVQVFLTPKDIYSAPMHVFDIFPPELSINTIDHSISEVDFISKTELMPSNIVRIFNEMIELSHFRDNLNFEVQGIVNANIASKFFQFDTNDLNVFFDYRLAVSDVLPPFKFTDWVIGTTTRTTSESYDVSKDESLEVKANVNLDTHLPLHFGLDSIVWDIGLKDCASNVIPWGEWHTSNIAVTPNNPISIDLTGIIDHTPLELSRPCQDGESNLSIVNRLAKKVLQKHPGDFVEIYVSGKDDDRNGKHLPPWLNDILNNIRARFKIPLDSGVVPSVEWQDYLVDHWFDHVSIEVKHDSKHGIVKQYAATNATFEFDVKPNVFAISEIGSPLISSHIKIRDMDSLLIESGTLQPCQVAIKNLSTHYDWDGLRVETIDVGVECDGVAVDIIQPERVGEIINSAINDDKETTQLYADVVVDEMKINLPYFKTILHDLHIDNLSLSSDQIFAYESVKRKPSNLDKLLSQMNITIDKIQYQQSTSSNLTLGIDLSVFNPTNITLDIPGDSVGVELSYNHTDIATVVTQDLYLPSQQQIMTHFEVVLNPDNDVDKLALERLVSEFISGGSVTEEDEDIKIGIRGAADSANKGLNELITQFQVDQLRIPQLVIARPDDSNNDEEQIDSKAARSSPFLIDSTIHILSSEIEITIYNPIANSELVVELHQAEAQYHGQILAHLSSPTKLVVTSGIYKTPRIPIKINNGIGMDILRKAINGQLDVEAIAVFGMKLHEYDMQLFYEGSGLTSNIKL